MTQILKPCEGSLIHSISPAPEPKDGFWHPLGSEELKEIAHIHHDDEDDTSFTEKLLKEMHIAPLFVRSRDLGYDDSLSESRGQYRDYDPAKPGAASGDEGEYNGDDTFDDYTIPDSYEDDYREFNSHLMYWY